MGLRTDLRAESRRVSGLHDLNSDWEAMKRSCGAVFFPVRADPDGSAASGLSGNAIEGSTGILMAVDLGGAE